MAKQEAAPNLASILDRPPATITRPKPLPAGTYVCVVKRFEYGKSAKKGTDYVEFTLAPFKAGDEIDLQELDFALTKPSGEKVQLKDRLIRHTCYITEDAAWRLKKFLNDCGIEDGTSLNAMVQESVNRDILITIKHTPSTDHETVYANVDTTARVK